MGHLRPGMPIRKRAQKAVGSDVLDASELTSFYSKVEHHVNTQYPGMGPDELDAEERHWPSAWSQFASAQALHTFASNGDGSREAAIRASEWLLGNADLDNDGTPGYGVPIPRRLFGRTEAVQPQVPHCVPTADSARALLDTYLVTKDARYVEHAAACIRSYAPFRNDHYHGICFRFIRTSEIPYEAINASALMAAQALRVANTNEDPDLRELAEQAFLHVISQAQGGPDCPLWPYQGDVRPNPFRPKRPNDLLHEAYIVRALADYIIWGGRHAEALRPGGLLRCLNRFIVDGQIREMPMDFTSTRQHRDPGVLERRARLGAVANALEASIILEGELGVEPVTSRALMRELEWRVQEDPWIGYPRHSTAVLRSIACCLAMATRRGEGWGMKVL